MDRSENAGSSSAATWAQQLGTAAPAVTARVSGAASRADRHLLPDRLLEPAQCVTTRRPAAGGFRAREALLKRVREGFSPCLPWTPSTVTDHGVARPAR